MEDLRSILSSHHGRSGHSSAQSSSPINTDIHPSTSEIPDLFFDDILINFKLTRTEILVIMYLYRITWCRPNLNKKYGIAPMISYTDLANSFDISNEIFFQAIRRLESFGFIETIRAGQYFVRKYFTEKLDKKYSQTYDNFL